MAYIFVKENYRRYMTEIEGELRPYILLRLDTIFLTESREEQGSDAASERA